MEGKLRDFSFSVLELKTYISYYNCFKMYFNLSKTASRPVNLILHGTCIPMPLPSLMGFPVISTVAELIVSALRKINTVFAITCLGKNIVEKCIFIVFSSTHPFS